MDPSSIETLIMLRNNKDLWNESDLHRILKRNDTELLNKNEVDILSVSNITSTSSSQTIIEPTTKTTNTSSSLNKNRSSASNTIMRSFRKSMSQEKEECAVVMTIMANSILILHNISVLSVTERFLLSFALHRMKAMRLRARLALV